MARDAIHPCIPAIFLAVAGRQFYGDASDFLGGYFEMASIVGVRVFLSALVIGCGLAISQAAAATFSFTLVGTVEAPATELTAEIGAPFRLTVLFDFDETDVEDTVSDDGASTDNQGIESYDVSPLSGSNLIVGKQTFDVSAGRFLVFNNTGEPMAPGDSLAGVFLLGSDLGFSFGLAGGESLLDGIDLIPALNAKDYDFASSSVFENLLEASVVTTNFIGSVQSTDLSIVPLPGAIVAYGSMLLAFGGLGGLMRRRTGITHA